MAEEAGATLCLGEGSPPSLTAPPGEGKDTLRGMKAEWSRPLTEEDKDPDRAARPIPEDAPTSGWGAVWLVTASGGAAGSASPTLCRAGVCTSRARPASLMAVNGSSSWVSEDG